MTADPVQHVHPLLDHHGPWSEQDYLALPEIEGLRIELVDGDLIMSPGPDNEHQLLVGGLWRELDRVLPTGIAVLPGGNVRLGPGRMNIPDVVVLREFTNSVVNQASDVLLAAEVVSSSGKARDRILKPALYAEAGIGWYLLVECEPQLAMILYRLDGEVYVEHARAAKGERLELPGFDAVIEVDALLRRRG